MPEPRRRRVTLTLSLTDDELARLACGTVVLDRIGTLAVLAVAPPSSEAPRRALVDTLAARCDSRAIPLPEGPMPARGQAPIVYWIAPSTH